ncbi:MAG TPA: hypothetical protein VGX21_07165 [Methylomirabilota bacterium]|nr:hypothetical protein [Methylomirabilota bacterium]
MPTRVARLPVRLDPAHPSCLAPGKRPKAGSPCLARRDPQTGVLQAAADPRREAYALGW